jgi:uncharacterized membrane protein YbaN (DUF454 family)
MFKRVVWILIGTMSGALGLIGVILPGLPTTPFSLLTVFAYSKGSKRFYTWFIQTKLYQKNLQSFHERRSMSRKQRKMLMIWSDLVVGISFVMVDHVLLRVMLIGLVIVKYWYFNKYITLIECDHDKENEVKLAIKHSQLTKGIKPS